MLLDMEFESHGLTQKATVVSERAAQGSEGSFTSGRADAGQ